jgi:TonB-dependent SusC/RagA subfamily outer membrane receptor
MAIKDFSRMATVCGLSVAALAGCSTASAPSSAPAPTELQAGAVSTLSGDELDDQRVGRIEEMIQGRVAGVQVVRRADGNYSIRIRGAQSFMGSSEPLVVIDGMAVQQHGLGSALAAINPRDVDRIEVLKDAGSTAYYGARGANGVIVITTKRSR